MMMPTAMSMTLPLAMKSLNSLIMCFPLERWQTGRTRARGGALACISRLRRKIWRLARLAPTRRLA
jgi:hypothetical protein